METTAAGVLDLLKAWGPKVGLTVLILGAVIYLVLKLLEILGKWLDKNQDRETQLTTIITNHLAHVQESNEKSINIQSKQLAEMQQHSQLLERGFDSIHKRMEKQEERQHQFEKDLYGKLGG